MAALQEQKGRIGVNIVLVQCNELYLRNAAD